MLKIIHEPEELERFCQMAPTLNSSAIARQKADAHLMIETTSGEVVARCSLWWKNAPAYEQHAVGLIGHYSAIDGEAGKEILQNACEILSANNCTMAIGPMDGNTWNRYRFITKRGEHPSFFLEPDNDDKLPEHFATVGFAPLAEYFSTITSNLTIRNTRMEIVAEQMKNLGVNIRSINLGNFPAELSRIYEVSRGAFQNNFLYTPIEEADFIAQYEQLKNFARPELILLAEHENHCIGFLFALPDMAQAMQGQAIDTFIVKTVAVFPEPQYAGLGSLLVARSHEIGAALGFTKAIHALMHEANKSRSISKHYSQEMRRYALFGKVL
jgi:GNAT superfamily N-acetyltransferase